MSIRDTNLFISMPFSISSYLSLCLKQIYTFRHSGCECSNCIFSDEDFHCYHHGNFGFLNKLLLSHDIFTGFTAEMSGPSRKCQRVESTSFAASHQELFVTFGRFLKFVPASLSSPARIIWDFLSSGLPTVPQGLFFCSSWLTGTFICPASSAASWILLPLTTQPASGDHHGRNQQILPMLLESVGTVLPSQWRQPWPF